MFHRDGKEYNGDWLMNAKSGYGEQTWPAGSKYSSYHGAWANGLPNGTGIMIYPSGMVYTGQFVDAKLQGDGQMKYANGDVRTGKFINDKREGEFILVTVDGLRYREQYSGDVRTSIEEIK
jgi:hypothetical protein